MATAPTLVVPGAPLEDGSGWRIWYSWAEQADTDLAADAPAEVRAWKGGVAQPLTTHWALDRLAGVERRMRLAEVRLTTPQAGEVYDVFVPQVETTCRWRTFAPHLERGPVTFLASSCFWANNDVHGAYANAIRHLTDKYEPAFKLLIGDQVYQDVPANPLALGTAIQQYARRYADTWEDAGYQQVLRSSPNYFLCDDHEFWNDYPEFQPHLSRTWTQASRAEYGHAARTLYEYYQRRLNPGSKPWYSFTIEPVSFFVADTRSQRDPAGRGAHFFQDEQWEDLERWVHTLSGPGVLVLGQPLFEGEGDWKDHALADFPADEGRLCALIRRSLVGCNAEGRPHDILMLSGDIHTARYAVGRLFGVPGREVWEVIASSASRVYPYFPTPQPDEPRNRFQTEYGDEPTTWDVEVKYAAIDDNLVVIRMEPGTLGRVRFSFVTWRVRRFGAHPFWARLLDPDDFGGLVPLFSTEIELE